MRVRVGGGESKKGDGQVTQDPEGCREDFSLSWSKEAVQEGCGQRRHCPYSGVHSIFCLLCGEDWIRAGNHSTSVPGGLKTLQM